jgi:amino acid transporter
LSDKTIDADTTRLHQMGYAQELTRRLGWFSNFAISFSIISILAGAMTTYWLGMQAGGPRAIMLSWIIVGFFVLLVGMSMAEICSTYPTAGGLYYWSAKLARSYAPYCR